MRKEKSIALVVNAARTIGNFRGTLIRSLVQRSLTTHVLAPDYTDEVRVAVREMGAVPHDYRLDQHGTSVAGELAACVSLYRKLRELKPDAVLAFQLKAMAYSGLAGRLAGTTKRYGIVEGLGSYFTDSDARQTSKQRMVRRMATLALKQSIHEMSAVFTLNSYDSSFVRSLNSRINRVIELEGIGLDLQEWPFRPPVQRPLVFLFIGKFIGPKGISEFVKAAHSISQERDDVKFVALGRLDHNVAALNSETVRDWKHAGIVEFPGHVDVKPWLEKSSVFVLPSYYREGKPRSTQEAMALGRPVITTDFPGCRETVIEGVNGFLVPPRDARALAAAMTRYIEQPSLIASMGAESRRLAEERYDVHKVNKIILDAMGL